MNEHLYSEKIRLNDEYVFTKMHGCGNDYVYFNCFDQEIINPEELSIRVSDRHFGIGADGIILICKSDCADAKMRMFNADGSEGLMCGNGIRCVGKYLLDNNIIQGESFTIETLSGIKHLKAIKQNDKVNLISVDMGKASFETKCIGVKLDLDEVIGYPIFMDGKTYEINCVSVGNPHCVVFVDNVDTINLPKIGPLFEKHRLFTNGINTEFVEKVGENTFKMRVWERGSGETLACGTGACAVASVAVHKNLCKMGSEIKIKLRGGDLYIKCTESGVYMTGPAEKVFDGRIKK